MIWVIDASVALRWLLTEERYTPADEVLTQVVHHPEYFAVPELFAFEVYAVLQQVHPDALSAFQKGIVPILQMGIFRQPMTADLAARAERFVKLGLNGFDACYAALAEDLKGKWLTCDRKAHLRIKRENISWLLDESMPKDWPA